MESPFPSRAELDPPEQTPHVCLLACSPHPDGSTDAAARLLEQALDRGWIVEVDRRIRAAAHSDELVPPDLRGPPVLAECVRDRVAAINSRTALVLVWFSA